MDRKFSTKEIVYLGLMSALTYVCTAFVSVPLPFAGYVHVGNVVIVIAAYLFGWKFGAISGAIGSTIADLSMPAFAMYAPFTFVIKFLLGAIVGIAVKKKGLISFALYVLAGFVVVGGYYTSEVFFKGNWLAPLIENTIPYTIEYSVSVVVGLIISKRLYKYFK